MLTLSKKQTKQKQKLPAVQTPFYLLNCSIIKQNAKAFVKTASKYFTNFDVFYSVKTNDITAVLDSVVKCGLGLEVASLRELKKALKFTKKIIFNGPCKKRVELKLALKHGVLINVDNFTELELIKRLSKQLSSHAEAGISVRLGIRYGVGKHGFDKTSFFDAVDKALQLGWLEALSFHPGTQLNMNKYRAALTAFFDVVSDLSINFKLIDVGGGFADKARMKTLNIKLDDYFIALCDLLKHYHINAKIIFEPGRYLVADAMQLITKVYYIKQNSGKLYAVCDAGINAVPKLSLAQIEIEKLNKQHKEKSNKKTNKKQNTKQRQVRYIITGPLLFSNDVLGIYNGNIEINDLLAIKNVGAYCYALAWQLSYKKPHIIVE